MRRTLALSLACSLVACGGAGGGSLSDATARDAASAPDDAAAADNGPALDARDDAEPPSEDARADDAPTLDGSTPDGSSLDGAVVDTSVLDTSVLDSSALDSSALDSSVLDGAPGDAPSLGPVGPAGVLVWQGFRHEWLREVLGFRVPHRISRLESGVETASLAPSGALAGVFRFGQDTGVDGNYQRPVGRFAALRGPSLLALEGARTFRFTDDADGGEYPQARTTLRETLRVPLDPRAPRERTERFAVVLRGLRIDSRCDPALQPPGMPCNSNGFWPVRVAVAVDPCARTTAGDALECPLRFDLARAWTPNRGGLPGFEEKPFNDRLTYEVEVRYTALAAPASAFTVTHGAIGTALAPARQDAPVRTMQLLRGAPAATATVVASTALGFEFVRSLNTDASRHLGRYVGTLDFGAALAAYDPRTGDARVELTTQVWIPDTVVATDVRYESRPALLQLTEPGARANAGAAVTSTLCSNSSPEAPAFSRWERCGPEPFGPERSAASAPLAAP